MFSNYLTLSTPGLSILEMQSSSFKEEGKLKVLSPVLAIYHPSIIEI